MPVIVVNHRSINLKESSFEKYLHDTVINSTKSLIDRKNLGFLQIVLCPGLNLSNLAFDKNLEPTDDEMDMDNNPQTNLSELKERHQWGIYLGAEQCRGFLAKHSIFYKTHSSIGQDTKNQSSSSIHLQNKRHSERGRNPPRPLDFLTQFFI